MVLERTLNNLRERPKEERTAIAAWVAIGVVAILLIGWLVYFLHNIVSQPPSDFQNVATSTATSTGQNGLQQDQQDESGSSTQFIETQGSLQLQQIGTSTYP
jgi:hypothetical protein